MYHSILKALASPPDLENLYRTNPDEFRRCFSQVFAENPDSTILQVWHERLFLEKKREIVKAAEIHNPGYRDVRLVIALSLIAGTLAKVPKLLGKGTFFFYSRNLSSIIFMALMSYFLIRNVNRNKIVGVVAVPSLATLLFLNFLPDRSHSQTVLLSCIHVPFFLWSLLGLAFLDQRWNDPLGRMEYLKYNGEVLIYTMIILLGGIVLTGLTLALFHLIRLNIARWYFEYVVVYGTVSAPIVATFIIDRISEKRFRIAPILAKIFTPLFLFTLVVYLLAMILYKRSLYTDRNFLLTYNLLLFVVLGLTIFSISERNKNEEKTFSDYINFALAFVTLFLDTFALSAILFRLTSYGYTPNRIAVLGANLAVFVHLSGIVYHYVRFIQRRGKLESLARWIVAYLPVYAIWSVIVTFGFPFVFGFK